ncbi:arginine--tRNA ligase [Kineococcus sp. TBRC 1896]|uniref:Arginine--tRNA ligase n=1 Tax=Kineococcus mangrovi TaxID=1660183 RepID=A0ABV4HYF7_9ACTN
MPTIENTLTSRLSTATRAAFGWSVEPDLRTATRPEFGHFQTNLPLRLARPLALSPRTVGERLIGALDVEDLCLPPVLAGVGFVNLTLSPEFLVGQVAARAADPHLGVDRPDAPQRIVVDYSSPNVAKQMHVGHLRSTVIGDALVRVLEFTGHEVLRRNHVGDWGTPFGMLLEHLAETGFPEEPDLAVLDGAYRSARRRFDEESGFADRARRRVVELQGGDSATRSLWERVVAASTDAFSVIYERLGVRLQPGDVVGESRYQDQLQATLDDLDALGLLRVSNGAVCAFLPGFRTREGDPLPLVLRKSDGGFGYDATDVAALRHRVAVDGADRLVHVVDARQGLHFEQVFALARAAGWLPEEVRAEHVAFGTVLGSDGRPFKTRDGGTVPLAALLDAAEQRAGSRDVGIGAVKYADLSCGLGRDYVFDLARMVATDGDTGPYLQYAHARLATLLARAGGAPGPVTTLEHPAELRVAFLLTRFPDVVQDVVSTLEPHRLCGYLHRLAVAVSAFYENCPVLRAEAAVRSSRLALCAAARRTLAAGLDLLGIAAPDTM